MVEISRDGKLENLVIVLSFSFLFPRKVPYLNKNTGFCYFPLTNEFFLTSFCVSVSHYFND